MNHDLSKYSNITKWMARIESEAPKYNEIQGPGIKAFKDFVEKLKKK